MTSKTEFGRVTHSQIFAPGEKAKAIEDALAASGIIGHLYEGRASGGDIAKALLGSFQPPSHSDILPKSEITV